LCNLSRRFGIRSESYGVCTRRLSEVSQCNVGKVNEYSHARALEILGAGLEFALGESNPASVEERLSGVGVSMKGFGNAPGEVRGKGFGGGKVGGGRGGCAVCSHFLCSTLDNEPLRTCHVNVSLLFNASLILASLSHLLDSNLFLSLTQTSAVTTTYLSLFIGYSPTTESYVWSNQTRTLGSIVDSSGAIPRA
jgi:hypothetical protein